MPRIYDDDIGLLWQTERKQGRYGSGVAAKPAVSVPLPESDWVAPPSFPDLSDRPVLGFDLETRDPDLFSKGPGVRRDDSWIVGWAVSDGDFSWYFPVRHEGGGNLDPGVVAAYMRDMLARFSGELYGANLQYDLDWAASEGVTFPRVRRYVDVLLAEPLLNEHHRSYSLNAILKRRYADVEKDEELLRQAAAHFGVDPKSGLWQLPARFVGPYAEADALLPIQVYREHLKRELEEQGLLELFDLECRLIPMLVAMRQRGVRVSDGLEQVTGYVQGRVEAVQGEIDREVGFAVNVAAGASLAQAFDALDIPYPRAPKTGNPSFQKTWLQGHRHPFARNIAECRKWEKVHGTFLQGHLGHAIKGRIHCEFNQLRSDDRGTISGRFSSTNPNLQNIPSRDPELGPLIRSLFVPDPGHTWWRFDWSQIEYRLLAHYAMGTGADDLRAQYNSDPDTDFHVLCGHMAGMDATDATTRKQVKNVNFGTVYGAGVETMAHTMGVSVAQARAFLERYHGELPFVRETQQAFSGRAARRGYIFTLLKRRARFDLWEPADYGGHGRKNRTVGAVVHAAAVKAWGQNIKRAFTYTALNRGLQGGAADLMKKAMVDIWESGLCDVIGPPSLTVHDELDWSAPADEPSLEALREVRHIMETCLVLRVPLKADAEHGPDWGHMEGTLT